MFRTFKEIEDYVFKNNIIKTVALANAEDDNALEAVVSAKRKGIIKAILIGNVLKIKELLNSWNENLNDYKFIECSDELESAKIAVNLVKTKEADFPMKGLMMTSSFMKAILDKENGLIEKGKLLSQASVVEFKEENRFIIISDCAVNIDPDVDKKIKITQNAINLANVLGIKKPNVAVLSALEKVNPSIQSTVDADIIAKYDGFNNMGSICGPLALDIAISKEAAKHKGINSEVCGNADILIVPDLASGNIFSKGLVFFAHLKMAGVLNGIKSPVVMTSRTDTPEDKYLSILMAVLQSL